MSMYLRTTIVIITLIIQNTASPDSQLYAQYMYLDSNGNGVHDIGDQVSGAGSTTVDVWLDTDSNRDGAAVACSTGGQPINITSYTVCLKAIGGGVSWGAFTNQRPTFTSAFQVASDSTSYHNGFGGTSPLTPGAYKLATITFSVTSGTPSVTITPLLSIGGDLITSFGSECLGLDFDNTLKLGSDWHDVDGIREYDTWPHGGVPLAPDFIDQGFPTAVSDGAGGAVVAWQEGLATTDLYVNRINAAGARQWGSGGVALCTATNFQRQPRSVPDASGGAIVVWQDERNSSFELYCRRVNSAGTALWTADGIRLCAASGNEVDPRIISDGAGGAFVAWIDYRAGSHTDIYAQHVDSLGVIAWTNNGAAVCTAAGNQGGVDLSRDDGGGAILTWIDQRSSPNAVYAQRLNSLGVAQWQTDGVPVVSTGASGLRIVADGSGGAIIAYGVSSDIFARRINSAGTLQWATPTNLCNATGSRNLSAILSDASGGAIVAWEDLRSGNRDVYAARVRSDSLALWSAGGVKVCTAPNDQFGIGIVTDGAGGAVIVWEDRRDEPTGADKDLGDIYMQRLSSNGTPLWNHNGSVVAKEEYGQRHPVLASDGSGGAIAAWDDYRNEYDTKIYAMRLRASGQHVTGVAVTQSLPPISVLRQNYPNPFNPTTTISFDLVRPGQVALRIYSVNGSLIRTLIDRPMIAGTHRIRWDGKTDKGSDVSTGVYFYRLEGNVSTPARTMVLIR